MYIKVHKRGERYIVAVCDKELVGKKFSDGKLCLDITERFYKGEEKNKEEIKNILKDAYNINFVGKKSIELGLELGIIQKEHILKIKEVPHAQFILL